MSLKEKMDSLIYKVEDLLDAIESEGYYAEFEPEINWIKNCIKNISNE